MLVDNSQLSDTDLNPVKFSYEAAVHGGGGCSVARHDELQCVKSVQSERRSSSFAVRRALLSQRSLIRSFASFSCLLLVTPPSLDAGLDDFSCSLSFRNRLFESKQVRISSMIPATRSVALFRFTGH